MIERELESALESELREGEELLWRSQPDPWRVARGALPIFLFGIPWTLFSLAWETMALVAAASMFLNGGPMGIGGMAFGIIFPIFGLPFIAIGVWLLSHPWTAYRAAQRTVYAITSRRALTITILFTRTFESYERIDPSQIRRVEDAAGNGDLLFRQGTSEAHGKTAVKEIGFYGVRQVRRVEEVLREMIASSNESEATADEDA